MAAAIEEAFGSDCLGMARSDANGDVGDVLSCVEGANETVLCC